MVMSMLTMRMVRTTLVHYYDAAYAHAEDDGGGGGGVDDDNGVGGNVNGGSGVDGDWWQRRKDSIALMIEHIWERYWKSQRVMILPRAIVKVQISKCGTTKTFVG